MLTSRNTSAISVGQGTYYRHFYGGILAFWFVNPNVVLEFVGFFVGPMFESNYMRSSVTLNRVLVHV